MLNSKKNHFKIDKFKSFLNKIALIIFDLKSSHKANKKYLISAFKIIYFMI